MLRYFLVFVLLFQSLQAGLVSAHVISEAAHGAAHGHVDGHAHEHAHEHDGELPANLEIQPIPGHCQLDGQGQPCHDHDGHTHHTTVVGLGSEHSLWLDDRTAGMHGRITAEKLPSGSLSRIERPKWRTTPPVVVNL